MKIETALDEDAAATPLGPKRGIFASVLAPGAMRAGRAVLDFLLPPHCLTCDEPVNAPGQLCVACFRKTDFITEPCCCRCGVPFDAVGFGGLDRICANCRAYPPEWGAARAALRYNAQTKRIVLPFKHGDRTEIAQALAPHMARAGAILLRQADLLVPVPLHRSRLRARRYNQSALLAGVLSRISGRPAVQDALQRIRATSSMGTKTAAERAAEVATAIVVRPRRRQIVEGARVLLIDDVLTSGATANACARALLAGRALGVDVLVAARVVDERRR